MELFFPLHPRFVHFPIALTLVGAATIAFGLMRRQERWLGYGRISLLLGWLGVLTAVATGLIDQSRAPQTAEVAGAINQHITAGVALLVVVGLALYWPLRDKKLFTGRIPRPYLVLLLAGVALVFVEGFLGGKLVYQLGVGVR
ncbi:MAG: DUF2231 domain-containing protein [Chloroflexi bacterium]|nr:DUF2231 domain-containing protein [Chloroflexota bacterium]